ncbi:hypothetical protein AMELA_G00016990 [Ameiurus melas]|uniref:Uncharacterized protein n=1 Tax=Ameiurus melas TaxID=219545 RepID=A0A7J6BDA4_AMEME|nr:hypothetical protein AMELA_G00016990 [Ameiurus melas]
MLKKCGDVMVLGDPSDPTLILVHRDVHNVLYQDCKSTELPLIVHDEKKRTFMCQFLLLGKEEHMTTCFNSFDDMWHLYDNDPGKPSFQPFNLESLKGYAICLAGYVNITQEQECKLGSAISLFSFDLAAILKLKEEWQGPLACKKAKCLRLSYAATFLGVSRVTFEQQIQSRAKERKKMERRAVKRKASVMSGTPNKRICQRNCDEMEKPTR